MRSVDEYLAAPYTNSYPDTHPVDPDYSALLDSALLVGIRGTVPQDNFGEEVSSQSGDSLAFVWMNPVDQQLANDFSPSHSFFQYADQTLFYPPSPPDVPWPSSSSLSQWDDATSHPNPPSMLGYYVDEGADTPAHPYWPGLNAMAASPCLDDFRSQGMAGDDSSGTVWSDGIALHCVEQPSYLSVNAGRHVPASTVFADHNLGFGESACFTTPSYDDNYPATSYYPSPPSTPQSLPRDHDRRHISLPKHGSPATPATNCWKCPYCNYVQGRRRMVDLKRHIATHNKPSDVALWTCCGFPREVARSKGVPDDVVRETSVIYGRVGGCWETFSRRDALQRHLRKQKGRCFGDAYADWHPGNSTKRDRRTKTRALVENTCQWDE